MTNTATTFILARSELGERNKLIDPTLMTKLLVRGALLMETLVMSSNRCFLMSPGLAVLKNSVL